MESYSKYIYKCENHLFEITWFKNNLQFEAFIFMPLIEWLLYCRFAESIDILRLDRFTFLINIPKYLLYKIYHL